MADEPRNPGNNPLNGLSELLHLIASAQQAPGTDGGGALYGEAVGLMGRLMLACAASGFRYWGRTAEIWGRTLPLAVEALRDGNGRAPGDPQAAARLMDELRASLRELAELPGQEARRLQADLERIVFSPQSGGGQGTSSAANAHWRRWEAKP